MSEGKFCVLAYDACRLFLATLGKHFNFTTGHWNGKGTVLEFDEFTRLLQYHMPGYPVERLKERAAALERALLWYYGQGRSSSKEAQLHQEANRQSLPEPLNEMRGEEASAC
jgi:hypothetical protein